MAGPNKLRGYEGRLLYTIGAGTQTNFAHITGWEIDLKGDEIDFTDHSTQGFKDKASGLLEWSGSFDSMALDNDVDGDAFFAAMTGAADIQAVFRKKTASGIKDYTGTISLTGLKTNAKGSTAQTNGYNFSGRGVLSQTAQV